MLPASYLDFLTEASVLKLSLQPRVQEVIQENKSDHAGQDMRNQNLGAANYAEADLKRSNLSGCDLRAAIFSRAVMYQANMSGSDLTNAFLDYAVLRGADLSGSLAVGANFVRADLGEAVVTGTDFTDAIIDKYQVASLCEHASGVNGATGVDTRQSLGCDSLKPYSGFNAGQKVRVIDAAR